MKQRTLKFRAWDKTRKSFHYPKLCDNTLPRNWEDHYILQQYTNLSDRNGVEIYEGDIIEAALMYHGKPSELKFRAKIVYNEYIGGFQLSYLNINNHFVNDEIYFRYEVEVIGNIFENANLLQP